jgi:hypothetical protein
VLAITVLAAAFGLIATAAIGLAPANAAVRSAAHVRPDTKAVSCTSSNVWLIIHDTAGRNCYKGLGALAVSLKGTTTADVTGEYEVCLYTKTTEKCFPGPSEDGFDPAINVTEISITVPVSLRSSRLPGAGQARKPRSRAAVPSRCSATA